jgi:hypothetical protein
MFKSLTLDTLELVAKMSPQQSKVLFHIFKFAKPMEYYEYHTFHDPDESYFYIGFKPRDPLGRPNVTQRKRSYWAIGLYTRWN